MLPKPLLSYFIGNSIFIENYPLNSENIIALSETIFHSKKYIECIILRNNKLKDK